MSTQHTPGPWNVQRNVVNYRSGRTALEIRGAGDDLIATLPGCDRDAVNARLIAAAPDLLEALKKIANLDYRGTNYTENILVDAIAVARAAIAKAEGQV